MLRTKGDKLDPRPLGRRRARAARATIAVLPTLFTLGNLLSGGAAIFIASRYQENIRLPWDQTALTIASACIFLGMAFDGLDGRIARLTRSTSNLGEQLDSMADMVTFGVAPAFIAVQLARIGLPFLDPARDQFFGRLTLVVAGIYICCTALRLARFNIEVAKPSEADHGSFSGLPSPGAAGTVASLVLLHEQLLREWAVDATSVGMTAIMLLVAFAMVSRLRYSHVMNRYFRGRMRFHNIDMLVAVLLLLLTNPQIALAGGFVAYAVSAPMTWAWRRTSQMLRKPRDPTPNAG